MSEIHYIGPEVRSFGGKANGIKFRVLELTFRDSAEGQTPVANPRRVAFSSGYFLNGQEIMQTDVTGGLESAAHDLLNSVNPRTGEPLFVRIDKQLPLPEAAATISDGLDADTAFNQPPREFAVDGDGRLMNAEGLTGEAEAVKKADAEKRQKAK